MRCVTRVATALCALLTASIATPAASGDVAPSAPCSGAGVVAIVQPNATAPVTIGPAVATATPLGASEPRFTDAQYGVDLTNPEAGAAGCVGADAPGGTRALAGAWSVLGTTLAGASLRADLVPAAGDGSGWHLRSSLGGLRVSGTPVAPVDGETVAVSNWATLTVDAQVQLPRLAPLRYWAAALELKLTHAHAGLPAGTLVLIGYAAANQAPAPPPAPPVTTQSTTTATTPTTTAVTTAAPPAVTTTTKKPAARPPAKHASPAPKHAHKKTKKKKKRLGPLSGQPLTVTPSLAESGYVFPVAGGADWGDTYGAARSDVPGGWHHGDDLFAPLGTPVLAVADGTVFAVGWNAVGGWRLWLADSSGNDFYYAHLSGYTKLAQNGGTVRRGDVLGFVGNTGDAFTTEPHLHFEVHPTSYLYLGYDGAVDPTTYLRAWPLARHVRVLPPVQLPSQAPLGFGSLTDFRRLLTVHPRPAKHQKAPAKPKGVRSAAALPHRSALVGARAARPSGGGDSAVPIVLGVVLLACGLAAIAYTARVGRT